MVHERGNMLIVGGGWAGIAAAVEAAERDWKVTLVEERQYLGGRARSFVDRTTGETIDNGQHLMMGAYHATRHVLKTIGTADRLRMQSALRVAFVDPSGRFDVLDAYRLAGSLGVADAILRLRHLPLSSKLRILLMAVRLRLGMVRGRGLTCRELLRRERQPADAVERFWEPIILATLNAPSDRADAHLLVTVMRLAFLGGRDDSKLIIPTGGLGELLAPFESWLRSRGGHVRVCTSCESVETHDGQVRRARLADGTVLDVDAVVFAIPERALRRVLGTDAVNAAANQGGEMSPIISVYLWYDTQWLEEEFVACLQTATQWVFNRRRIQSDASPVVAQTYPGHVSLTISAGAELAGRPSEEIIASCDAELRTLFPEMGECVLKHGLVIKERMATPLITPETVRPSINSFINIASNLAIAGDWVDTGLPATIEGAARSGVKAVEWLSSAKGSSQRG